MLALLVTVAVATIPQAKWLLRMVAVLDDGAAKVTITDCQRPSPDVVRCHVVLYRGRGPHAAHVAREGVVRFGHPNRITFR